MRLTTRGRYGMRAMIELARSYGRGPVLMRSISDCQEIPRKYLHALLTNLRASGLVTSSRGSRGGYSLARPPGEITAAEILASLEGPIEIVDCGEPGNRCRMYRSCASRRLWDDLNRTIEQRLESVKLSELAARPGGAPKVTKP